MEPVFIYIVAPDIAVARKLSRGLVEERMAACANILPEVQAIYRWQGRVEEANEVGIFVKTTRDRFEEITDYVLLHHPYEVPCIVALPLVDGEKTYLRWMLDNSAPPDMPKMSGP